MKEKGNEGQNADEQPNRPGVCDKDGDGDGGGVGGRGFKKAKAESVRCLLNITIYPPLQGCATLAIWLFGYFNLVC
jgi:hypothetical protein